jgi:hypothetical protein
MTGDVEALLRRERRAALPLWRQCLLYLDPFALFKDVSSGPKLAREQALSYNRAMRWILLAYVRRWAVIALGLAAVIAPAEAAAAQASFFVIPAAAAAVGACIALTVAALTVAVYVLLGSDRS